MMGVYPSVSAHVGAEHISENTVAEILDLKAQNYIQAAIYVVVKLFDRH